MTDSFLSLTHITKKTNDYLRVTTTNFYKYFKQNVLNINNSSIIGLYGDFGTGKSSLLYLLKEDEDIKEDYEFIIFDAWEHEKRGTIEKPLLLELANATGDFPKYKKEVLKILTVIGLSATEILFRNLLKIGIKNIKDIFGIVEKDEFNDEAEKASKKYRETIEEILKKEGKECLIIAIDNLDRCMPDNVMSIIYSTYIFFASDGNRVKFILSASDSVLREYVRKKYGGVFDDGDVFLEKLVKHHSTIPKPVVKQFEQYAKSLVGKVSNNAIINNALDIANFMNYSQKLRNPRKFVVIINRLISYYNYDIELSKKSDSVDCKNTAKTILGHIQLLAISITTSWKNFIDWILFVDEEAVKQFYRDIVIRECEVCGSDICVHILDVTANYKDIVDSDLIMLLRKVKIKEPDMKERSLLETDIVYLKDRIMDLREMGLL